MTDYYRNRWRTQAEATVGEGFARILGRYPDSWNDSWFDHNGDSISAARLVAFLQKSTGVRLRLADVLSRSSTVGSIAERLSSVPAFNRDSCLSIHNDGGSDDDPVLVYLHHPAGTAYAGYLLAKTTGVTVCSVRAAGLEGERPVPRRIEDFARIYREQIAEAFPRRPIWTSGFSAGGLLAFELGHQIREAGMRAGGVILFDSPRPHAHLDTEPPDLIRTQQDRLNELLRRVGADEELMAEAYSVPAASLTRLAGLSEPMVSALVAGAAVPHREAERAILDQLDVWGAMHEAPYAYRPRRLPGRLHYLLAAEDLEVARSWENMADEVLMAYVPGEHFDYGLFRDEKFHTVLNGWLAAARPASERSQVV